MAKVTEEVLKQDLRTARLSHLPWQELLQVVLGEVDRGATPERAVRDVVKGLRKTAEILANLKAEDALKRAKETDNCLWNASWLEDNYLPKTLNKDDLIALIQDNDRAREVLESDKPEGVKIGFIMGFVKGAGLNVDGQLVRALVQNTP